MSYSPNDFEIVKATKENLDEYLEFLDEFFSPREQLTTGLHVETEEMTAFLRRRLEDWISSGTSTCAIYIPTNQLVGVSFTTILTRDNAATFEMNDAVGCSKNFQMLIKVLVEMEKRANLFQDPKVDKILEIAATAVRPEFSGNRITYRLAEESERLAKELGCQLVTSQSTNKVTQHIRKKMGHEEVVKIDYETLEIDGERVIDMSVLNGSVCALVLRKYLQ